MLTWLRSYLSKPRKGICNFEKQPFEDPWSEESILTYWQTLDLRGNLCPVAWSLRKAYEGTIIFGASGSGKTSGSGKQLRQAFLEAGFGGLVLSVKPGEAQLWIEEASKYEREVELFGVSHAHRFNPLQYEARQPGASTYSIAQVLSDVAEIAFPRNKQDEWQAYGQNLFRNAIRLLRLAGEQITYDTIDILIVPDTQFIEGLFDKAKKNNLNESEKRDLEATERFFLQKWPAIPDKMRGSIATTAQQTIDAFLTEEIADLFGKDTTLAPHETFEGKIIIIDMPVMLTGPLGYVVNAAWKSCFQSAVKRRQVNRNSRPVFLWNDEFQFLALKADAEYQSVCRDRKACTVYLTQSLPAVEQALCSGVGAERLAAGLLANLSTKIAHRNACYRTNIWFSDMIGKTWSFRENSNVNTNIADGKTSAGSNQGRSENLEYDLDPRLFQQLASGGTQNDYVVAGIIYCGGDIFPNNGNVWTYAAWQQKDQ